jgi:hypothetical protein
MVEILFGLRRKLEREWTSSKIKAKSKANKKKQQCLGKDFFYKK